jgi:hypothetical protein
MMGSEVSLGRRPLSAALVELPIPRKLASAASIGVGDRQVRRWAAGDTAPPPPPRKLLVLLLAAKITVAAVEAA